MSQDGRWIAREEVIPSDLAEARRVQAEVEEALQAYQFSERDVFAIKLALEEALVNAIKHGNQMDLTKRVRVAYHVRPGRFDVRITDEGPGFNPADVPDPTAPENLERPCGRGLLLIRHYMTEVHFLDRGTTIWMSKHPCAGGCGEGDCGGGPPAG
ncbi:MAG TPA: ATP-binding protein [Gemmataceae bacterium]